jgi:hypothetical protein
MLRDEYREKFTNHHQPNKASGQHPDNLAQTNYIQTKMLLYHLKSVTCCDMKKVTSGEQTPK